VVPGSKRTVFEVDLPPPQFQDLTLNTPASQVREGHDGLELRRQVAADGQKFLALEESGSHIVFLQHRNIGKLRTGLHRGRRICGLQLRIGRSGPSIPVIQVQTFAPDSLEGTLAILRSNKQMISGLADGRRPFCDGELSSYPKMSRMSGTRLLPRTASLTQGVGM
jgi:hypothetical protein